MNQKLIEIIGMSFIYGYIWVFITIGMQKTGITDWLKVKGVDYCPYCCSFWLGITLGIVYGFYSVDWFMLLVPMIGSAIASTQLNRYYN